MYCHSLRRKAASGRLAVSLIILLLTVGVVGVGTWGLTDSIKNTNHQVDTAWEIVGTAKSTVSVVASAQLCNASWASMESTGALQVQNVTTIATTIFSLLDQLSGTLLSTSQVLTGVPALQCCF